MSLSSKMLISNRKLFYNIPLKVLDFRLQSMGRRCGHWSSYSLSLPQHTIESPFNVTIKFHSDASETFPGFEAKWTTLTSKSEYLPLIGEFTVDKTRL